MAKLRHIINEGRVASLHSDFGAMKSVKAHLEAVAYHEAGHAVAALRRHLRVLDITIDPDREFSGRLRYAKYFRRHELEHSNSDYLRRKVENFALVCLAGPEAQRKYDPRSIRVAWHGDQQQALSTFLDFCGMGADERARAWYRFI